MSSVSSAHSLLPRVRPTGPPSRLHPRHTPIPPACPSLHFPRGDRPCGLPTPENENSQKTNRNAHGKWRTLLGMRRDDDLEEKTGEEARGWKRVRFWNDVPCSCLLIRCGFCSK